MWYRSAQLYKRNLPEFSPMVAPDQRNNVALPGAPGQYQPMLNRTQNQWSMATWGPQYGLQFWNTNGKLIATQKPGMSVFETLRSFEPYRFKSDVTDKIVFDLYRRGKSIEQAVQLARTQNPAITPQQISQVIAPYMKEYYITPKFDEYGNLQNMPEYYPQQSVQEDAIIRQNMEREYLNAPKKAGEQGFQFTTPQPTETGQQYRARYTDAYAKAYESYESNGRKMPFTQWKKQFDEDFTRGQYGSSTGLVNPVMNQVQTQNQTAGTYQMKQDAVGNVSIVQSNGRVYAYIPADQVQYQSAYIKKMTGQIPANMTKTQ